MGTDGYSWHVEAAGFGQSVGCYSLTSVEKSDRLRIHFPVEFGYVGCLS